MEDESYRSAHLFGIRKKGLDLIELQHSLTENQIYVSLRGDSVRVSLNVFNDETNLETFINAL